MNTKELTKSLQVIIEEALEVKINQEKAREVLDALFDSIGDAMASGEKVDVVGFGKFEAAQRAERNGHNPATGEKIVIPAQLTPKFKAAKALKDKVKK